ncbi:MAG: Exonuclease SbcC [Methanothrix sp.]|nr:MAG: Exonuclease SbcC [Methanothrix sp.]
MSRRIGRWKSNLQGGERDENQGFVGASGGPNPPDGSGRRRRDVPGDIRGAVDELRRGIGVDRRDLRELPEGASHLPRPPLHDGRGVSPDGRRPPRQPAASLGVVTSPGPRPAGRTADPAPDLGRGPGAERRGPIRGVGMDRSCHFLPGEAQGGGRFLRGY